MEHTDAHLTLAIDQFDVDERAMCGCRLARNTKGRVTHRFCPMHHAAPTLLSALEGIHKRANNHRLGGVAVLSPEFHLHEIEREARAAILAAKGEANA